jgi:hydrogenase nickel incorporation protein HypB
MKIKIVQNILSVNDLIAKENSNLLTSNKIFSVNVMASPGAGKTSTVLQTIKALKGKVKIGVIEGDISSTIDSETVAKTGTPVVQINTGGECHLDANMIQNALGNLPLKQIELLLIENVGNLVCPAEFNLGENRKVMIASVPEGDDKPYKYPLMFTSVDAIILNKIDLLPYVKFDIDAFTRAVKAINADVKIFPISCTTGEGITKWANWLRGQMKTATATLNKKTA